MSFEIRLTSYLFMDKWSTTKPREMSPKCGVSGEKTRQNSRSLFLLSLYSNFPCLWELLKARILSSMWFAGLQTVSPDPHCALNADAFQSLDFSTNIGLIVSTYIHPTQSWASTPATSPLSSLVVLLNSLPGVYYLVSLLGV